jgi:hypothetical protein
MVGAPLPFYGYVLFSAVGIYKFFIFFFQSLTQKIGIYYIFLCLAKTLFSKRLILLAIVLYSMLCIIIYYNSLITFFLLFGYFIFCFYFRDKMVFLQ